MSEAEFRNEQKEEPAVASSFLEANETPSAVYVDVGSIDFGEFEKELQRQLALREEEIMKLTSQIEELEAGRQQDVEELAAEIERIKDITAKEVKSARSACEQAQEELKILQARMNVELDDDCSEKWGSVVPQQFPELSSQTKELSLQKERLQRQHSCELKAQEQRLRSEFRLGNESLQSRLEEEYTAKLAKVVTDSAVKNATHVEQISQQLRLEKQRAVAQIEEEKEACYKKDMARQADEYREAYQAEFESAGKSYESKIAELELEMANECDKAVVDLLKLEEKVRGEMGEEFSKKVQAECAQKETALINLRGALENQLQTELTNADKIHRQSLVKQRMQLQAEFEKELGTLKESQVQSVMPVEKLQAIHKAELGAIQRAGEDNCRHQEEVKEKMELRLHQELQQLTEFHKAEVERLTQQHQAQLDKMSLSHQQAIAQVQKSVEQSVWSALEEQHYSQLQQVNKAHSTQLVLMEKSGTEKVLELSKELEEAKEQNTVLLMQLTIMKEEHAGAQALAEQQLHILSQREQENRKLSDEVQEAGLREQEREKQEDRQHCEDTASLAILQKQLSVLSSEKTALLSYLDMVQSSMLGCVQLATLVEWTLSQSSTSSHAQSWDKTEDKEGEDTLTPPSTTSPSCTVAGLSSATSVTCSTTFYSDSLLKHTPSDDSGLASQQASVVNSEVITPMMDATSGSPVMSHDSPHPPQHPNLTILPLDDTTPSHEVSQAPFPFDQSQIGMLSISFLDGTQHHRITPQEQSTVPAHAHNSQPYSLPTPCTTHSGNVSISQDQTLLPLNLSHLPAVQGQLSRLHRAVSTLLECYVSLSSEAADYQKQLATTRLELKESISLQVSLTNRVTQLENEALSRDEKLVHAERHVTTAQENIQRIVDEVEEERVKVGNLQLQLSTAKEALAATEQQEEETQDVLRKELDAQKLALESLQSESQQKTQMLDTEMVQLREELQAAQTNCANAVCEREAMHEENKRLAVIQMSLEGQLHSLREESEVKVQKYKNELKQREREIRELQMVGVQLSSHQEALEMLRIERDDLQQRLNSVEHQLAMCKVESVEKQIARIQELTASEAQLANDLRQKEATCHALQERVRVAQEGLNMTTQENLSIKMSHAQLEGEVSRLCDELQRRETALQRTQAHCDGQAQQLSEAQNQLSKLRAKLQNQECVKQDNENEGEESSRPVEDSPSNNLTLPLQQELQHQREVTHSLHTQIRLLQDTLKSKDHELETLRMARSHQDMIIQQLRSEEHETADSNVQANAEEESVLHTSHSSASTRLQDSGDISLILGRLTKLAPMLSQDADTVNQLTKNLLSLESERSRTTQLENELHDKEGLIAQLQSELKDLRTTLTIDMEDAQSNLAQYQKVEDSLEQSRHAITCLHKELRASKEKEAVLQTALEELSSTTSEQLYKTQLQHTAALASLQKMLEIEATSNNDWCTQLSSVEKQLHEAQEARQADLAEKRQIALSIECGRKELKRLHESTRRVEEECAEKEAELKRFQGLLQAMEADNKEKEIHYNQLLANENGMVMSLRSSIQAKEHELTQIMDKLLHEKVNSAKAQEELAAVRARFQTAQHNMECLENKLAALHDETDNKEVEKKVELEQLRGQLHQLQLKEFCQLRNVLKDNEEAIENLQEQTTSQRMPKSICVPTLQESPFHMKLIQLYAKYRQAEVHRKALVFQKNYLKCQVDAFFQTQQAALIIMSEIGAPPFKNAKVKPGRQYILKFKTAVHVVVAVFRFRYVVWRKHQYIQSYSSRLKREKNGVKEAVECRHVGNYATSVSEKGPISSICSQQLHSTTPVGSVAPPSILSTVNGSQPCLSHFTSTRAVSSRTLCGPKHETNNQPNTAVNLSSFIPSLGRLQAKLGNTVK